MKKSHRVTTLFPLASALFISLISESQAAVVITPQSSTGTAFSSTSWFSSMSATDLVNAGQPTLTLATVTAPFFGPEGTNDGVSGDNESTQSSFFSAGGGLGNNFTEAGGTAIATFDLNLAANTLGYDITSIESFIGWNANSGLHGNQNYTVEVSAVGSASYTSLTSVAYSPFTSANSNHHESHVTITDTSGVLATGVDSIRFTFTNPGLGGTAPGTVIRELDVEGIATVPEPSATMLGLVSIAFFFRRRRRS